MIDRKLMSQIQQEFGSLIVNLCDHIHILDLSHLNTTTYYLHPPTTTPLNKKDAKFTKILMRSLHKIKHAWYFSTSKLW